LEQSPSWETKSASQEIPPIIYNPKYHYHIHKRSQRVTILSVTWTIITMTHFYSEEFLAHCQVPKLEDHRLSAVRDCLFNIFPATLHIAACYAIRNLRTHHFVVTGTHLSCSIRHVAITRRFKWTRVWGTHVCDTKCRKLQPKSQL
jgi:hypothetical protein